MILFEWQTPSTLDQLVSTGMRVRTIADCFRTVSASLLPTLFGAGIRTRPESSGEVMSDLGPAIALALCRFEQLETRRRQALAAPSPAEPRKP